MCMQVRMCLVINKMDRLVHELRLGPGEAFERLQGIITHVNMIVSAFQSEHFISEADAFMAHDSAPGSWGGQRVSFVPGLSLAWQQE